MRDGFNLKILPKQRLNRFSHLSHNPAGHLRKNEAPIIAKTLNGLTRLTLVYKLQLFGFVFLLSADCGHTIETSAVSLSKTNQRLPRPGQGKSPELGCDDADESASTR